MTAPHWYLLGAGNMGSLAAYYLLKAGHQVTVVRQAALQPQSKTLHWADHSESLKLAQRLPSECHAPITHLLITSKTPYTSQQLAAIQPSLANDVLVVQLQNGILDIGAQLPPGARCITALTTSAVKGQHPIHHVVAENSTWWGDQQPVPPWFSALQASWPNLHWDPQIQKRQWYKLVINAVINPLTAIHDVANGAISDNLSIRQQAEALCQEANAILQTVDPVWPGVPFNEVIAVAEATSNNTSSMRADHQQRQRTEVQAINGVLLAYARDYGISAPLQQWVVDQLAG